MRENFRKKINDEDLFEKFEEVRIALNEYLDGSTNFNVNGVISRRQLMEVFIYGDLSHANCQDKRRHFKSWMENELMAELMKNEFKFIVGKILILIARVDKLCKEAIERYGNT
ncbi:MAG: hypothetical protein ACJAY1_001787 [Glaciecola sp.]|jgi:hypothetical protein